LIRYGFIGLGALGGRLAASLLRAGFSLHVHDVDPKAAKPLLMKGAIWRDSPRSLAANVDAAITCLPSPYVSERVLSGPNGLLSGLPAGATWIEMSTNDSDRSCASPQSRLRKASLRRPRSQSSSAAKQSCSSATVRRSKRWGGLKRGGIDLAQLYHVVKASSGNSFVHETETQLILNGSYDVGFTMELACKDLGFAVSLGRELGVPLDLAAITAHPFIRARSQPSRRAGVSGWTGCGCAGPDRPASPTCGR